MIRIFGLVIMSRRKYIKDLSNAFDCGMNAKELFADFIKTKIEQNKQTSKTTKSKKKVK